MFLNCCANIINICTIIMMCLMLACDVRVGLPRTDANTIWYIVVGIQFLWVHSQYSLYFLLKVKCMCSSAVGHLQMSILDFMLDDGGEGGGWWGNAAISHRSRQEPSLWRTIVVILDSCSGLSVLLIAGLCGVARFHYTTPFLRCNPVWVIPFPHPIFGDLAIIAKSPI